MDTPFVVERSIRRLLLLVAVGLLLSALSGAIAVGLIPGGILAALIGAFGTLFFGAATALTLWRLLTLPRAALVLDAEGILDRRLSPDVVPWHAIAGARVETIMGQSFIVLSVDPDVETRLRVSPVQRLSRAANAGFGFEGVLIAVQDLDIDAGRLWHAIVAYREAHEPLAEPSPAGAA